MLLINENKVKGAFFSILLGIGIVSVFINTLSISRYFVEGGSELRWSNILFKNSELPSVSDLEKLHFINYVALKINNTSYYINKDDFVWNVRVNDKEKFSDVTLIGIIKKIEDYLNTPAKKIHILPLQQLETYTQVN